MNRGQKTLRNLLLSLLLALAVYAMLGFPPYTVRGMLDRTERLCLLSDLEPVLVERRSWKYSNAWFANHDTYLLARTGGTYVFSSFRRCALEVRQGRSREMKVGRDALCAAFDETLYVAGDFADAASASVEVTVERTTLNYDPETEKAEVAIGERKTFVYPGEKRSDEVFSFPYREDDGVEDWGVWGPVTGLEGAAHNWYRRYVKGQGGSGIIHVDLPVKVTLYGQDGEVLNTLELTIDNYELFQDW